MEKEMLLRLVQSCSRELSGSGGEAADSRAFRFKPSFPLVNVFWDGVSGEAADTVRSVFSELWPSGPLTGELVRFMEGNCDAKALTALVNANAIKLRQNNGNIKTMGTLCVAHYLPLSAPGLERQLEAICALHEKPSESFADFSGIVFPLVFLFNDFDYDRITEGHQRLRLCHRRLSRVGALREVALGPLLRDNSYLRRSDSGLDKGQFLENYRIAADIAFLSCTAPNGEGMPSGLQAWLESSADMVTASYLLKEKPSERIAAVTLDALREERLRLARERNTALKNDYAALDATQFFARLELKPNRLDCLEEAFDELIRPRLPAESKLEPIYRWARAKREEDFASADAVTSGALGLFVRRYFTVHAGELDSAYVEAVADSFSRELLERTDFLFAEEAFDTCAGFLSELRPTQTQPGIYEGAVNAARVQFYALMRPALQEAMRRRAAEARAFHRSLEEIGQQLRLPPLAHELGLEDVDEFYDRRAKDFLDHDRLCRELMPSERPEAVYEQLETAFSSLVRGAHDDIYHTSLEAELDQRTEKKADGTAQRVFQDFFGDSLTDKQRLPVMSVKPDNSMGFYLIYAGLKLGANSKEGVQTVRTGCADRAERLELYHVDPDTLRGGGSGT